MSANPNPNANIISSASSDSASASESGPPSPISTTTSTPSSSTPPSPVAEKDFSHSKNVSEEDRDAASKFKAQANEAFKNNKFPAAALLYSQAIDLNPTDATLFCNRAITRMKLEEYGYALLDTNKALELDPKYTKAIYRRALCHLQTLKPQQAIKDFKHLLTLDPKNAVAKSQLEETRKLVRRAEFEKAIAVEEGQTAVERCREIVKEGGCTVDNTYAGPHLPTTSSSDSESPTTYTITPEFITSMLTWFKSGKTLAKRYVWEIVLGAYDAFMKEESMVDVVLEEGVTCDVIGDVHGQFYDLLHLFSLTGPPSDKHILLMNGDLVDRGSWSIEVILTAFAYKWLYPNRMYINRGNHETKTMNETYGFEGEAKHKHGDQTYKLFAHVFTAMPLATLITATLPQTSPTLPSSQQPAILSPEGFRRFFVVHGGLFSKDDVTLEQIRKVERVGRQPGDSGLMCELLWTDPQTLPGRGPSKRGVGIAFGPDVTKRWCNANKVTGVFRSHEVRQDGFEIEHDGLCTTVFSAPNYVDMSGNKGAFIRVDAAGSLDYKQFEAQPHPDLKPMAYVQRGLAGMMM